MSVPKRRTSHSRTRTRRSHDALKPIPMWVDPATGKISEPHTLDMETGMYRGKQIFKPKEAEATE